MFFLLEFVLFKNASHSKDLSHKQTTCTATKSRYKKVYKFTKELKIYAKQDCFHLRTKSRRTAVKKKLRERKRNVK